MDHSAHNKIVSFIWSIADDCIRDVFVRGKYRDVILPMFVLRRLDCLLEPSKEAVLEEVHFQREDAEMADLDPHGLREASGYVFYNTSRFTLKSLLGNPSQLEANLKNYLDGFSDNVKEIVEKFDLRNQIRKMAQSDVLHDVIEKFVSDEINLSPNDRKGPDGRTQPGLSNLGMGYVFEELIRKFNEENNEEAGDLSLPAYDTRPSDGEVESIREWTLSTITDSARRTSQSIMVVDRTPGFFTVEGIHAHVLVENQGRSIGCVVITRPLTTEYVRRVMGRFYKEGDVARLQKMGSDHEAFHCIEAAEPSLQGGGTVYTESRADAYAAIQGYQRGEADFIGRWADARASRAKEDPDHDTAASIRKVLSDARTKIAMTREKVIAVIRSATTL